MPSCAYLTRLLRLLGWCSLLVLLAGCATQPVEPDEPDDPAIVELAAKEGLIPGPAPGKPREEYHVTIKAQPVIAPDPRFANTEWGQRNPWFTLPAVDGRPITLVVDSERSPWYHLMPPNKVLTFTVWQTKDFCTHDKDGKEYFMWGSAIETISDGWTTLYDARICPVHHQRMQRVEIRILYGYRVDLAGDEETSATFPFGVTHRWGGCGVSALLPTREMSYLCKACVEARQRVEADVMKAAEWAPSQPEGNTDWVVPEALLE